MAMHVPPTNLQHTDVRYGAMPQHSLRLYRVQTHTKAPYAYSIRTPGPTALRTSSILTYYMVLCRSVDCDSAEYEVIRAWRSYSAPTPMRIATTVLTRGYDTTRALVCVFLYPIGIPAIMYFAMRRAGVPGTTLPRTTLLSRY
eukprot:1469506-Rhodomonas_salina.3